MHSRYCSIENHYREKYIEKCIGILTKKIPFVVTEKVHGSNMQFYVHSSKSSGFKIEVGKRNNFIKEGDSFFPEAVKYVQKKYEEVIKNLFKACVKMYPDLEINMVVLYGELFGGKYPGFISNYNPIQREVYYCPKFDFYPFDIRVFYNSEKKVWATFIEFEKLMKEIKFEGYSKPLLIGSFEECLSIKTDFKSTIPATLNLIDIKDKNICEGVVIKPYDRNLYIGSNRMIIKKKNENFKEVAKRRKIPFVKESKKVSEIWENLQRYCTDQRFNNVISKEGNITKKMTGKMIGLLNKDTLDEFNKDFPEWKKKLSKKESKKIKHRLTEKSRVIVKNYFNKNI